MPTNDRGFDGDAMITLSISAIIGILTLGLTHLSALILIVRRASTCGVDDSNVSAVAIPGHQLEDGAISEDYKSRLDRAFALYTGSDSIIIRIIGGRPQNGLSEARAGHQYLLDQGIPEAVLSMEESSMNTLENMQRSRAWFTQHERVLLVTNRYHLARLQVLAKGLHLQTLPCAAESHISLPVGKIIIEMFFLHWYWSGRIFAKITGNQRMLDKIS